jgi:hypothetical protein
VLNPTRALAGKDKIVLCTPLLLFPFWMIPAAGMIEPPGLPGSRIATNLPLEDVQCLPTLPAA